MDRSLQLDPRAEVIDIPNKDVRPEVMDIISIILNTLAIPSNVIDQINDLITRQIIRQGSNYLAIDILDIILDNKYEILHLIHPNINLVDIKSLSNRDTYTQILTFAIHYRSPAILNYVLNRVPAELYPDIDDKMFVEIVTYNSKRIFIISSESNEIIYQKRS